MLYLVLMRLTVDLLTFSIFNFFGSSRPSSAKSRILVEFSDFCPRRFTATEILDQFVSLFFLKPDIICSIP